MTGYTVHTGSNNKFRDGWDRVFASKSRTNKNVTENKSTDKATPDKSAKPRKAKKS